MQEIISTFGVRTSALPAAGFLLLTLFPLDKAIASNAVTLDSGYGYEDTRLLRLNFSAFKSRRYPANDGWYWNYYWEGNLSYWYLYKNKNGVDDLFEAGITPNIRLELEQAMPWGYPFMEAGLGIHLLSKVHIGTRDLASSFQFGTHMGFGTRFGSRRQWEVAWRIEHLSNADLQQPNPGINFSMVRFGYRW